MKKMKKLFAVLLTLAMVLGMSMTSFAADTKPVESDSAVVTVNDIEAGATITAYQIIDAKYDTNGFVGYVWATGMNKVSKQPDTAVTDPEAEVTADMITELAKDTDGLYQYPNAIVSGKTALTVGTWMLIVTPPASNPAKVYNPMIVSVYYNTNKTGDSNTAIGGSVSAGDYFTVESTPAYAKSTDVSITKTVKKDDEKAAVGSNVSFTITGTIPSYSSEYTSATYTITDTLVNGLVFDKVQPVVKVGDNVLAADNYTFTSDNTSFEIAFKSDYILGLANKSAAERAVEVTYSAKVTEAAITRLGENKVTLNYTTKPGENSGAKEDSDFVATFSLDNVLEKVKKDGSALDGAEFTLYKKYENNTLSEKVTSYTTKTDGDIEFKGLDGDLTYYLKETKAPNGYSINDTVYKVEFTNVIKEGKKITSYDVKITDLTTNKTVTGTISYGTPSSNFVTTVVNTKISSLPSTGGIGTTIFTIAGCVIMIAAAGLFFASRKKSDNK